MAAARTSKRPLLPPKPAKLLQANGLPRLASNRDSILPTSITPETQKSLDVIFSFDTEANEGRIAEVWPRRCSFIVKEILHTERNYVESLGEVIKGYLTPLYSYLLTSRSGEGPNFIRTVFSNIVKIHKIHMKLLENLQNSCTDPQEFGQVFLQWEFLSQYSVYCTNYAKGNECLEKSLQENEKLRAFIEQCKVEIGHSLPLDSQLIKPVQRILKYRLFLGELTKHMDTDHDAYKNLQEALEKMSKVTEQINTSFCKPKKVNRLAPSIIAKRRSREVRDLQRSRTLGPQPKPVVVQRRASFESGTTISRYSYTSFSHSRHASMPDTLCCISEEQHRHHGSMPCVHELRNYFESLSQKEDRRAMYKDFLPSPKGSPKQRRRFNGRTTPPRHRAYSVSQQPKLDLLTSELKKLHINCSHETSTSSNSSKSP